MEMGSDIVPSSLSKSLTFFVVAGSCGSDLRTPELEIVSEFRSSLTLLKSLSARILVL